MTSEIVSLTCPKCGDGYWLMGPYDLGEERECPRCGHVWMPAEED